MTGIKKLLCLGGDDRRNYTVERLNESGFTAESSLDFKISHEFDGIILPLPVSSDRINIKGTDISIAEFCSSVDETKVIFAGKAYEDVKNVLLSRGISFYDYSVRPEFASKNSIPTAQGVLQFLLQNTEVTINSMTVVVIGYGNCGRALCRIFKSVGADVVSASRRYISLADAESDGVKSILIKDMLKILPFADAVVNTVPATILKQPVIDAVRDDAVIIDISSYPYGFDYKYAEKCGKKINLLPSLPGKYFPKTAGIIIADTIKNIIEEEGL